MKLEENASQHKTIQPNVQQKQASWQVDSFVECFVESFEARLRVKDTDLTGRDLEIRIESLRELLEVVETSKLYLARLALQMDFRGKPLHKMELKKILFLNH